MSNNQIWKSIIIFSCIICLVILSGCEPEINLLEWVTVEHEQYNFSIETPNKWVTELYGDTGRKGVDDTKLVIMRQGSIFGSPPSPTTFIILVERRAFDNPSLQDTLDWGNESIDRDLSQEGLQTFPGYEEFLFKEEEIAGYSAIRRRYTDFGLGGVTREEIYISREDDMITISLWVDEEYFDDFYPDFQRIVDSFKTIPSENDNSGLE
jgi:hypothetical protein